MRTACVLFFSIAFLFSCISIAQKSEQLSKSDCTIGYIIDQNRISDTAGGFLGVINDFDYFGAACDTIGDLDDDDVTDIIIGAHSDNDGGTDHGAVWILFMHSNRTVKSYQKISSTQGGFLGVINDVDIFGAEIACLGDLDNDGVEDVAVSAGRGNDGGNDRGGFWVLFLNTDGTVKSHQKVSDLSGNFTGLLDNDDLFGDGLENIGDLDGDGVVDIAVGAREDDDGGADRGCIWILFMNTDGTVKSHQKISSTEGGFSDTLTNGGRFGASVTRLGDLDKDGITELAVGAITDDDGVGDAGAVWILFMNPDGTVKAQQKISSTEGFFTGVLDSLDYFGQVGSLGDINNDGTPDLLVGSQGDDDSLANSGAIWILLLNPDGTVKAHQKISALEGNLNGPLEGDGFGVNVSFLQTKHNDSLEIMVGAYASDDGGNTRGAVYILTLCAYNGISADKEVQPIDAKCAVDPLAIFPNPFDQQTRIEFYNPYSKPYTMIVTNTLGQVVYRQDEIKNDWVSLEKGNLSPGNYTIELIGESMFTGKIIIK